MTDPTRPWLGSPNPPPSWVTPAQAFGSPARKGIQEDTMAARKKKAAEKPKAPRAKASKLGAPADTKIERFRQNMRCELSEADINERSRRVAHQLSEKAIRIEAAKSATAHIKAEIKQIDADISRLAQEINDGATYREVECERRFVYRTGKVVEVRTDTSVQTFERAMTGMERQLELPKGKAAKAKETLEAEGIEVTSNEGAKQAVNDEEAPDQPGSDEPPESGETDDGQDDEDPPESGEQGDETEDATG